VVRERARRGLTPAPGPVLELLGDGSRAPDPKAFDTEAVAGIATSEVRIGRELVDTARRNRDAHGGVSPPTLEDLLAVPLKTRTDE
jgi:hypothetical protein